MVDGTRRSRKSDKEREEEREMERNRGGGKEESYADIEAALESLNVIRLKGF